MKKRGATHYRGHCGSGSVRGADGGSGKIVVRLAASVEMPSWGRLRKRILKYVKLISVVVNLHRLRMKCLAKASGCCAGWRPGIDLQPTVRNVGDKQAAELKLSKSVRHPVMRQQLSYFTRSHPMKTK
ncbi:hypothetical protein PSTH1771_08790 [Pseudomonas syringae pv. theae]|nr:MULTISPECIES: hypothetical protein [Pseudomonas syringae group]NVL53409.1 hypothetical protein [Pseudomonas syringae pv. actinidiae]UQW76030.1 hypothetical protein L2Y01_09690 [Pseudomonas avellanae]GKS05096.1 hypothetical protein PSTH1771_08790 [Pseudomonas syringae pv. theae]